MVSMVDEVKPEGVYLEKAGGVWPITYIGKAAIADSSIAIQYRSSGGTHQT